MIPDIDDFGVRLRQFLSNRRRNQANGDSEQHDTEQMDGMSIRWIALLFATFASGVQLSSLPKHDRELLSQVYGQYSKLQPSLED